VENNLKASLPATVGERLPMAVNLVLKYWRYILSEKPGFAIFRYLVTKIGLANACFVLFLQLDKKKPCFKAV
jgi:hypothetical protein